MEIFIEAKRRLWTIATQAAMTENSFSNFRFSYNLCMNCNLYLDLSELTNKNIV